MNERGRCVLNEKDDPGGCSDTKCVCFFKIMWWLLIPVLIVIGTVNLGCNGTLQQVVMVISYKH